MFPRIFKLFTFLSLLVYVRAVPTPTVVARAATTTGCEPGVTTGPAIRVVTPSTPVTNLELGDTGGVAVLKKLGWHGLWLFGSGGIAKIEWTSGCYAVKYLNVETSANSYKPLTWSNANLTTIWRVPYEGDIGTIPTCTSETNTNFLTCQQNGGWTLYFQTGSDTPAGVTCIPIKLRSTAT